MNTSARNMEPVTAAELSSEELARLRSEHYNATLIAVYPVHDDLRIVRVVQDNGVLMFVPGQYFTLGLGNWEPRVQGADAESPDEAGHWRLIRRAYSASCSLLDDRGELRRANEFAYLEFYLALVRHSDLRPPALTPRLFVLQQGQRLFVSPHAIGRYTLESIDNHSDVFFFATGTGEAPHNTMVAELLRRGHQGQIVSIVSVRYLNDAAYRYSHQDLTRRFPNYHYLVWATRDSSQRSELGQRPGGRHLQDMVNSGELERLTGVHLDPTKAHVFLCGNPLMIGLVPPKAGVDETYEPGSMLDLLLRRGFRMAQHGEPGNVHFERYW